MDNRGKPGGNVNFFSSVKISVATKSPVHPSLTSCTSDFRTTDNRVKIRACTSACIRMLVLKIRNRRLSRIIKTRRCVCAGTRARNSTQIRWSVYVCTQDEGGRKREKCVCVGERGGDVAWWRGNVCERNAAKKTGHVCRQQINENKVASSSYSGAPAERSTSIYTTQGSDLIWETDLHPRTWMAKEGGRCKGRRRRRERKRERKERREERRCWQWRQPRRRWGRREGTTGWKSDRRKRIHRCLLENSLPPFDFSHRLNGRIE